MTTFDYRAVNARGVTVHTFGDLQTARRWAREHAPEHDGLRIECVTTIVTTRTMYTPRAYLREVA